MSDELTNIFLDLLHDLAIMKHSDEKLIEKYRKKFLSWHIRESRKWALSKLPKEIEDLFVYPQDRATRADGYNQAIAEMRKKIEESDG